MTPSRLPTREECVTRYLLARRAEAFGASPLIRTEDGVEISYRDFMRSVEAVAAGLASLGVKQDDTVAVWLPNSVDAIRIWFAINWLGAVYVPFNVAYRGNLLAHVLANSQAKLLVASVDLVPRLDTIERAGLETVVVVGGEAEPVDGLRLVQREQLEGDPQDVPALARPIEPWDTQAVIYTSGTTGRSKGVVSSYAHLFTASGREAFYMIEDGECCLVCGPLFHLVAIVPVLAALDRGGTIGMMGDFSTETFWQAVRGTKATFVMLLGMTAAFIAGRPPARDDREHTLEKVMLIPLAESWREFGARFGTTVWTLFNMSELSVPIVSGPNPEVRGTCGRGRSGMELRIVDENDREVADGTVGELIVRADTPWVINSGYFRDDEATAKAWRNGWFHTGDGFRRDEDGNYFFVDRLKDAIRRRGENISSVEVELEVAAHPSVRECAVVAVPSSTSEDEVLLVVAPKPGHVIDAAELLAFLQPRLAHFMLPRFIRTMQDLPRTQTAKIEKHVLRAAGVTSDTWDRERAGIRIRRDKIRG